MCNSRSVIKNKNKSSINGGIIMSKKNNEILKSMKEEIASELGVDLKSANLTAKDAGKVGGKMTKELVEKGKNSK